MSGGGATLVVLSALFYIAGGVLAAWGFRTCRQVYHLREHGRVYRAVVVEVRHGPRPSRTASDTQYWVEAMVDGAPKRLRACVTGTRDALFPDQTLKVLYSPRYPEVFYCDRLGGGAGIARLLAGLGCIVFITLVLVLG